MKRETFLRVVMHTACLVMILSGPGCGKKEQQTKPSAAKTAQQGKSSVRSPGTPEHTANAISASPATEALTNEEDVETLEVPGASAGGSFRQRSWQEMEQALGQRIQTRQHAINAAYLAIGWHQGEPSTPVQDNDAYARARRWGFDIAALISSGRERRFSSSDLANGPIQWSPPPTSGSQVASAFSSPADSAAGETAAPAVVQPAVVQPDVPQPAVASNINTQRIEKLQEEITRLEQTIQLVIKQLESISNYSKNGKLSRDMAQARTVLESMEKLIINSEAMVAQKRHEIHQLQGRFAQ